MSVTTKKQGQLEYLVAEGISVPHCFTTRLGGVSQGILSSLNIGYNRGDDPKNVEENYRIFKNAEVTHESGLWGDTYRFSVTTMPHEMDTDDFSMLGFSADNMFKLVVTIKMPGTIVAEGAKINENTASFTITDLEKEHVLTVESSTTNVAGIIAIVIAAIILIAVLILVFFRRKPRHNQAFE